MNKSALQNTIIFLEKNLGKGIYLLMSYITSKDLSGDEARTGVARTEKKARDTKRDEVVNLAKQMASQLLKEEREKKESNIKKEKRKKKTVAAKK